ncbi:type II toxin-antitoxin system HicA family toxin [Aquiflexum sp. AIY15W]|nr:type II toxin-antitoxin system HicA family toxin [Cognataquiflexum rubidum]MCH6235198.1 type II toxin-antitoxin system HicA family toxin [Cognataquiflexum rubidum]
MVSLLNKLGYQERKLGKTSGSRMAFFRLESQSIIRIHKPHPGNIIKLYVIDMLIEVLRKEYLL